MCLVTPQHCVGSHQQKGSGVVSTGKPSFSNLSGHSCYSSVVTWVFFFFKQAAYRRLRVSHILITRHGLYISVSSGVVC